MGGKVLELESERLLLKGGDARSIKIAINMINQGYTCEQIAEATELPLPKIRSMKKTVTNRD